MVSKAAGRWRFRWLKMRSACLRRHRGDSLLEFALVLPILLALCVGMIEFGLVLTAQNQLLFAAREGVRTAALYGDPQAGVTISVQNMSTVHWVQLRAVANGCNQFANTCVMSLCATYDLAIPFVFTQRITLSSQAFALTERDSNGASCYDSRSLYPNPSSPQANPCQPPGVSSC